MNKMLAVWGSPSDIDKFLIPLGTGDETYPGNHLHHTHLLVQPQAIGNPWS